MPHHESEIFTPGVFAWVRVRSIVLQFDTTDLGHRFAEAWKRARIIVDAGTGQGNNPPPPPAPNPAPGNP